VIQGIEIAARIKQQPIGSSGNCRFTVFDIDPALFDRSCLRVKSWLGEVLQRV